MPSQFPKNGSHIKYAHLNTLEKCRQMIAINCEPTVNGSGHQVGGRDQKNRSEKNADKPPKML